MDEIISSILSAEKKADEIIKTANEKSKKAVLDGEARCDKIKETAIADFKKHRKEVIEKANKKAEKQYADRISEGKVQAEALINTTKVKIEGIAQEIAKEIIG